MGELHIVENININICRKSIRKESHKFFWRLQCAIVGDIICISLPEWHNAPFLSWLRNFDWQDCTMHSYLSYSTILGDIICTCPPEWHNIPQSSYECETFTDKMKQFPIVGRYMKFWEILPAYVSMNGTVFQSNSKFGNLTKKVK